MSEDTEEIAAALLAILMKNQKFMSETQDSFNSMAEKLEFPEQDNSAMVTAMQENTKQLAAMTKAILATIVKPKIEWDFDITRDSVNGHIKSIRATPGNE